MRTIWWRISKMRSMRYSRIFATLSLTAAAFAAAGVTPAATQAPEPADTAYRNGFIYTVDAADSVQQALAIRAGRIVYVGSDAGLAPYLGERTSLIDLHGRSKFCRPSWAAAWSTSASASPPNNGVRAAPLAWALRADADVGAVPGGDLEFRTAVVDQGPGQRHVVRHDRDHVMTGGHHRVIESAARVRPHGETSVEHHRHVGRARFAGVHAPVVVRIEIDDTRYLSLI